MSSGKDDGENTRLSEPCFDNFKIDIALEAQESPSTAKKGVKELKKESSYHTLLPNRKDLCIFHHQGSKNSPLQPNICPKSSKADSLPKSSSKSTSSQHREGEKGAGWWLEQQQQKGSPFPLLSLLLLFSSLTSVYQTNTWLSPAIDKHLRPTPMIPPSFQLLSTTQEHHYSFYHTANFNSPRERKVLATVQNHLQNMTSSVISGGQEPPKQTVTPHKLEEDANKGQERELFDPMVGTFRANPSTPYDSFFKNSKMRWRGELELAEYAWNQDRQVNMLMTEQMRTGRAATSGTVNPVNSANPGSVNIQSEGSQQQQTSGPSSRNDDPSLMDYEAIDVYWRRDIEQEKGSLAIPSGYYTHPNQGQQHNRVMDSATEQYEQDLQLLTEKSLFVPLNTEERYRYENLSKAHYSDFYRALGQPLQTGAKQKGLTPVEEGTIATTSSNKYIGGGSVVLLTDISYNQQTSASTHRASTHFPHEVHRQSTNKNEPFSDYDQDKPEDFFSHLAKENQDNEPLPMFGVSSSASVVPTTELIDPIQAYSTNVSLCSPHPVLLNNVSLSEAAGPVSAANLTDVFSTNVTATNTSMSNMFTLPQVSTLLELDDTASSTDFSSNSALMASDSFPRNIEYGFSREINETFSPAFRNHTGSHTYADNYISSAGMDGSNVAIPTDEYFNFSTYSNSVDVIVVDSESNRDRGVSPSSGIGSMCSSTSSPRSLEDSNPASRFHNKLVPVIDDKATMSDNEESMPATYINARRLSEIQEASIYPRRRGRQSKDEQLVNDNDLPATAEQITVMTHQEIQKMMRDPKLSAAQKVLIKKIRRRGRNKVAARKCRERRAPTSEDESVIYNTNTVYNHYKIHQPEDTYMNESNYNYARPSTSKQSTSSYYNSNSHF